LRRLDYFGRGWAVPLNPRLDSPRSLAYESGPEKVRQSILIILETEPGERLMRPTFGCGLRRYLMKPNTSATRALIQREVALALKLWEPRIDLQTVQVSPGDDAALIFIAIFYTNKPDGRQGNLVYPFYLQ
jgi:phage baseplate assembly protein W